MQSYISQLQPFSGNYVMMRSEVTMATFYWLFKGFWHYRLLYFDIKMHSQNFCGKFLH